MSKEKQIEEMAKIFCGMKNGCDGCMCDKVHCNERNYAEEIYNAGYRKQSEPISCGHEKGCEWISVDERLPSADEIRDEYGELVPFLVVEKDTTQPFRAFYDGFVWGDGFVKLDVTHWMPLPMPPKENKND